MEALDPQRVVRFCVYHGIVPSVFRAMRQRERGAGGTPVVAALTPHARAAAATGLWKADVLSTLLRRFAEADIDVIPLKGTGLDVRFYGGPGRRKDGDHDLLVRPDQLSGAARVLRALGFESATPGAAPPDRWPQVWGPSRHHGPPFLRRAGAPARGLAATPTPRDGAPDGPYAASAAVLSVELHWLVTSAPPHFPVEEPAALTRQVWERSRAGRLLNAPVRWPAPEDELLVLMLHAARHLAGNSVRLSMLEDIARFTDSVSGLQCDAVVERARRSGPVRICGPLRALWRTVLGAPPEWLSVGDPSALTWPPSWGGHLFSTSVLLKDREVPAARGPRTDLQRFYEVILKLSLLQTLVDRGKLLWRALTNAFSHEGQNRRAVPIPLPVGVRWMGGAIRLARLVWTLWRDRLPFSGVGPRAEDDSAPR